MRRLRWMLAALTVVCAGVSRGAPMFQEPSSAGQEARLELPRIDRRPPAAVFRWGPLESLPRYDPDSKDPWQMDLRSRDLSHLDLRESLEDLLYATFDDRTVWPPDDLLPPGFDRQRIMELGRNPGLGLRALHDRGVTGRGVGVAIIDQTLLIEHEEYADRLRLYEEIGVDPEGDAAMHASAVASLMVGRTVGVAPEADLYFIASRTVDWDPEARETRWNFEHYARAIRRILEINEQLPPDREIRAVSISVGWPPGRKGYDDIMAANREAIAAGLLVVSSSIEHTHELDFFMLGRASMSDPDDFGSYDRVLWRDYGNYRSDQRLLIPCDSRATASPTGTDEYVFYRIGGASWSIPYLAGVYALAAQVDPKITPDRFWDTAMKTGRTIERERDGEATRIRPILDPAAIIRALREG